MRHDQDNGLESVDRISRGCMGGNVGRSVIQAEDRRDKHTIKPKPIINDAGTCSKGKVEVDE